ncbi:MAG: hypothetical protein FJ405_12685, partial [Verrucomicrobia bacterium]|nr:hypothetical protein [Verrucomicrobiota bacterium]
MKKLHALLLASAVCFDLSAGSPASRSPAMDLALSLNEAFASAADSASRSVVVINVITRNPVSLRLRDPELDAESLPSEPRHQREGSRSYSDGGGRKGGQAFTAQPLSYDSQGSGVILREDGYILTNRHVVDDAQHIHVRLADGREYSGELRGVDALSDLAVVKIEACDLKVATLGNSDRTRVGEF